MVRKHGGRRGSGRPATPYNRRNHSGAPPVSNAFSALIGVDNTQNGRATAAPMPSETEMNAHLPERFSKMPAAGSDEPGPSRSQAPRALLNTDLRKYFDDLKQPVKGGEWLSKQEVPSSDEILGRLQQGKQNIITVNPEPVLKANKVQGNYDSVEEYLGTHYELLREDAIRPLRESVGKVRAQPYQSEGQYGDGSIGVYEPLHFTAVVFSPRGLAVRVAFSLNRVGKRIRWEQSKRLITGSLVALSPVDDAFKTTCILATVAARSLTALDQNPPEVDLFFARAEEIELDPSRPYIMVENRRGFYESSRHTLVALQKLMREPFPLSEHLVDVQTEVEPPKYLQNNPWADLSSIVAIEDSPRFENVNILKEWPNTDTTGLDDSQSYALERIMTKRVAIVQGPPGTGKTHVSVVALKAMIGSMQEGDPPVIVTCQTNHALDQLLRHVHQFEPNFIRLGGRSKDMEIVKKRTLYEVRQNFSSTAIAKTFKGPAIKAMTDLTKTMKMILAPLEANQNAPINHRVLQQLGLLTEAQADSLEMPAVENQSPMEVWLGKAIMEARRPIAPDDFGFEIEDIDLEYEQIRELEAEAFAKDDDDFETLRGPVTLLSDNVTGKIMVKLSDAQVLRQLEKPNMHSIDFKYRGSLYRYLQVNAKQRIVAAFRREAKRYDEYAQKRRIGMWEQDQLLLADSKVIGMTTTGLSKYRPLIASLRPKVLVLEEAAETLESPVAAGCLPSLEHLVLVGDHKQLRPHCNVQEYEEEPYFLNVSLFERLVENGVQFSTLKSQRRMIPEVRRLLKPIYEDTLVDHPTVKDVKNRRPVEGMGGCNSWFFTHNWPETQDEHNSLLNAKEAQMVVGFFDYLVYNGIDVERITVLTFYNGQRKKILKLMRSHPNLRNHPFLKVVTVDSYQGEENDIVLLSLVRSNDRFKIGFLEVANRVCVALSRAKRGFYMFGNGELLCGESRLWADVVTIMAGKSHKDEIPKTGPLQRVGFKLHVQCKNHGNKNFLEDPDDWELLNGGCEQPCRCHLPCGHTCMLRCHPFSATRINCTQKCMKAVEGCGHPCSGICCDPCRCDVCVKATKGTRPTLKPASQQQNMNMAIAPGTPASRVITTSSAVKSWKAYANGGVKEDDKAYMQRLKEHRDNSHGISLTRVEENFGDTSSQFPDATSTAASMAPPPTPTRTASTSKLIKISPIKNAAPLAPKPDTDLLIDFTMETSPTQRSPYQEAFAASMTSEPLVPQSVAHENEKSRSKAKPRKAPTNLLD